MPAPLCRHAQRQVLGYPCIKEWWGMRCLLCGEEMRVVKVDAHAVDMPGFEIRTFQCVGCGDTEKRQIFDNARSVHSVEAKPPVVPQPPPPTIPSGRMRSILGSLMRLRRNLHS